MNEKLEELLKEIYEAYEAQLTDATDLFIKGWCTSAQDQANMLHNKEGLLSYFMSLLAEVRDIFEGY